MAILVVDAERHDGDRRLDRGQKCGCGARARAVVTDLDDVCVKQ
jgi:hypothetical protein